MADKVIDRVVTVAAKLQSSLETHLWDVLAVAEEIDPNAVTLHLRRGDDNALREQLERGLKIFESDELNTDFGVISGPLLSQKRQSPPSRTTW
jgi:hypothetical protein